MKNKIIHKQSYSPPKNPLFLHIYNLIKHVIKIRNKLSSNPRPTRIIFFSLLHIFSKKGLNQPPSPTMFLRFYDNLTIFATKNNKNEKYIGSA
jgi:hypothetical protein